MAISTVALTDTFDVWRQITNTIIARLNEIGDYNAVTIIGGNIDGTAIGVSTPSTGVFTALTVATSLTLTGTTLILDDNAISGNKISGGTIDNVIVELSSAPTIASHATRKDYVDTQIIGQEENAIAMAMIFGG